MNKSPLPRFFFCGDAIQPAFVHSVWLNVDRSSQKLLLLLPPIDGLFSAWTFNSIRDIFWLIMVAKEPAVPGSRGKSAGDLAPRTVGLVGASRDS